MIGSRNNKRAIYIRAGDRKMKIGQCRQNGHPNNTQSIKAEQPAEMDPQISKITWNQ